MLTTLLESRSPRRGSKLGAAVSTALHTALIVSALYVTNARSLPAVAPDEPVTIHMTRTDPILPIPNRSSARAQGRHPSAPLSPPALNLSIAVDVPSVDIQPGLSTLEDFPEPGNGATNNGTASGDSKIADGETYDALEVDTPAMSLEGNPAPVYPASLRAAGIEGSVVAQFVVDGRGRAAATSVRIVSSTNDLFSESVKAAIPKMRFVAARIRGEPVQQTVRQLFVFKLSR